MPAHPRLRAAKAVNRHSLSRAQQRRKNHKCKSSDAKCQPQRRAPHRSRPEWDAIGGIEQQGDAGNCERRDEPALMRAINAQLSVSWSGYLFAIRVIGIVATGFVAERAVS